MRRLCSEIAHKDTLNDYDHGHDDDDDNASVFRFYLSPVSAS